MTHLADRLGQKGYEMGSLDYDERQHNSGGSEAFDDAVDARVDAMLQDLEILSDAVRDLPCLYFTHPSTREVIMDDGRIAKLALSGTTTGTMALSALRNGDYMLFGRIVAGELCEYLQEQARDELERESSDRGDV